ncbi:MAG: type II secretion system protein [Sulfurovum sp.]|nr:type II secretion system protein [Sulfurovum sp.]
MYFVRQREAFSMVTAIIVIVIMATVAILIMNLSGNTVKETTAQYHREQAMLLAKSYTEYAIMAVMANGRTTNCLTDIDGQVKIDESSTVTVANGNGYQIRVRIAYIGETSEISTCKTAAAVRVFSDTVTTLKTPMSIIVDVYVEYKDPENTNGGWITYHKRTLQKI